jgi:hypothetical protein
MQSPWKELDLELMELEDKLHIPNWQLENVPFIIIRHSFHINDFPKKFDSGEIIYNGNASDDIRGRIEKHLLGKVSKSRSAVSIDLLLSNCTSSHRKKAFCSNGNTAYCNNERIREKRQLLQLNLVP